MRKLIVSTIVSLDGYCAGPGGDVMALPMDHAFDAHNAERLRAADTLLLGATSYRMFSGYWPAIAEDENSSADNREISRLNGAIAKVVVSDTLTPADGGAWRDTTEVVSREQAHARVAALKLGPGRDILVFASPTLWHDLARGGLVDEVHAMVGPVVLGDGIPGLVRGDLRLLGTRTFAGSDNVLLTYGRP
ncbi:dihydrofolate reductase family protein [Actinokineospora sp. NBRC 105648]|uniref:dihydrofolate reductase family protein n=1 Tax=Actinokineospora sp. NBRC 105648 TaxID=3032206 RepID=UPI00249FA882|nr:dihydrofolate reductase family protein [Actinokineospora sp. NBRC 105648]GLZ37241.1 pyrimidine reductase [Actinokineospora sp. NBRC 105648]